MTSIVAGAGAHAIPRPRRIKEFGTAAKSRLALSAAVAIAATAALFTLTPLDGPFGFAVVAYAFLLVTYGIVERQASGGLTARDHVASIVVVTAGAVAIAPLLLIVGFVVTKGREAFGAHLFTQAMDTVAPRDPATVGGAKHAIVGSLEQVGLATLITVPLGVLTAISLNEHRGRLARPTRFFVEAMSGIPSVVAGLFIFTFWVGPRGLGMGFSGFAGALALAVLMLPIVARLAEEMLRLVPQTLREASLALGAPEWRTTLRIVLPAARSGMITAVILGVARVAGETAPLVFTAFGSFGQNTNPFHGPQAALPLFVYQQIFTPNPTQITRAWAGALVLLAMVLVLFVAARTRIRRSA